MQPHESLELRIYGIGELRLSQNLLQQYSQCWYVQASIQLFIEITSLKLIIYSVNKLAKGEITSIAAPLLCAMQKYQKNDRS